jgi:capsular polysaccharide biosynthesis protein
VAEGNASSIVARSWPLLLAATIVCGALGYLVASNLTPSYRASVELLTGPVNTDFNTLQASGELARTYSELATTRPLLQTVADSTGIEGGADELDDKISATSSTVTRVVTIYATDSDPQRAGDLATKVANELRGIQIADADADLRSVDELMRRTELQGFEGATREAVRKAAEAVFSAPSAGVLSVVNPAETPKNQAGPPVALITALAALAGFVIAFLLLWIRDVARRPVRSEAELAEAAAAPRLATVRVPRGAKAARNVTDRFDDPTIGEGFRLLYANLGVDEHGTDIRSIAVIDVDDHATARAVGAGIAAAAMEAGIRSALIDPIDEVGAVPAKVSEAGGPLAIVVLPPLTRSAAAVAWARSCDATVLSASRFRTSTSAFTNTAEALGHAGVHLVGTVLVASPRRMHTHVAVPSRARTGKDAVPHRTDELQPVTDAR